MAVFTPYDNTGAIRVKAVTAGDTGVGPYDAETGALRVDVIGGGALPTGGTAGQVLTKVSSTDGDATWQNAGGGGKITLTADTTFYISTTGNDTTGDGSIGAPWGTPLGAWKRIANDYSLNGFVAIMQFLDGDYPAPNLDGVTGILGFVSFLGNASNVHAVRFILSADYQAGIQLSTIPPSTIYVNDITLHANDALNGTVGLKAVNGSTIYCGYDHDFAYHNMGLEGTFAFVNYAYNGGYIDFEPTNVDWAGTINGGTYINCSIQNAIIFDYVGSWTVTGDVAMLSYVYVSISSYSYVYTGAFTGGNVTGQHYIVDKNGILEGSANCPGTTPGTTATGGQAL